MKRDILALLVEESAKAVRESKRQKPLNEMIAEAKPAERNLKNAIEAKKDGIALIAEIKKASPLNGAFCKDFSVGKIASLYNNHAQAISVVTSASFQGKKEFVREAKVASTLPVLRKDFIIDEYQLYESLALGADAVLLIASIVSKKKLQSFVGLAKEIGLQCLVEVHDSKEIESLPEEAEIIGINNRDLKTMKIDFKNFEKISKLVPKEKLLVAESGYDSKQQIDSLKGKADAVLIGSALLKAQDIEQRLFGLGF